MGFKVVTKRTMSAASVLVPGDAPPTSSDLDNFWGILVKYIPAPIIVGYKFLEEMFLAAGRSSEMPIVYVLILIATPFVVAYLTLEGAPLTIEHIKSIKIQIVMTIFAFIIWTLVMSRWLNFDPLWGNVFLILFTFIAPAFGKYAYDKGY